jgi:hypothetical protein
MVMILMVYFSGFKVVFTAMPAAFAALDVPPVYAMLFFLSMFFIKSCMGHISGSFYVNIEEKV